MCCFDNLLYCVDVLCCYGNFKVELGQCLYYCIMGFFKVIYDQYFGFVYVEWWESGIYIIIDY